MVGTLRRMVQKVLARKIDMDWDTCLGQVLGGYRRRPCTYGKSPFEILLGIKLSFSFEAPYYGPVAANGELIRGTEIALVKSLKSSRIVPYIPSKYSSMFVVRNMLLVR